MDDKLTIRAATSGPTRDWRTGILGFLWKA
jgi:hypothetical protein